MVLFQYYNGAIVRTDDEVVLQSIVFMVLPTELNILSASQWLCVLGNHWAYMRVVVACLDS